VLVQAYSIFANLPLELAIAIPADQFETRATAITEHVNIAVAWGTTEHLLDNERQAVNALPHIYGKGG
jgi:hypothetical protein